MIATSAKVFLARLAKKYGRKCLAVDSFEAVVYMGCS